MKKITLGRKSTNDFVYSDGRVSGTHCTITINNGSITVEDHSSNGTFYNGVKKLHCSFVVKRTDVIVLAGIVEVKISDILSAVEAKAAPVKPAEPELDVKNLKQYVDFRQVSKDYKQLSALMAFLEQLNQKKGSQPAYVIPSVMAAIAAKELRSQHYPSAQKLLYEAGDICFSALDGSAAMEGCYASMMALLAELYQASFHYDVAEEAGRLAVGIFGRWLGKKGKVSLEMAAYAYTVYADALRSNGKNEYAKLGYSKAIELYKKAGTDNPLLSAAKITELEHKITNC